MCGITGIYAFNLVGKVHMVNMANAVKSLAHRGPDFQNTYNTSSIGIGHRRLSILDTRPEAHQPMFDETGQYALSYNGEIYNFRELREELASEGVKFKTTGDTEVLLYWLIRHGEKGLARLNGFFSFVFFHITSEELLLATDRSGIKPLYWMMDNDKFLFGSELESLMEYGMEREIDRDALMLYQQLNYIPPPFSILKGVRKLRPGHFIQINREKFRLEKWYNPENSSGRGTGEDPVRKLKALISKSVERRLIADVPLGSFLSGGLDSSIIAYEAMKHKGSLETFSVEFEEADFDESPWSRQVADSLGSSHHPFPITRRDFLDQLYPLLDSLNEPFADSSAIAYYLLSRETRKHVTVALSGDGADELFGGYVKHLGYLRSRQSTVANSLLKLLNPAISLLPAARSGGLNQTRRLKRYSALLGKSGGEKYWQLASFLSRREVKRIWYRDMSKWEPSEDYHNFREELIRPLNADGGINTFLDTDLELVLPGDMLTKVDRMSMAHGLEVRVPFLDPEVIAFARSLDARYKIEGDIQKKILREAYGEHLPAEIFQRPKKGFEVPLRKWLQKAVTMDRIDPFFDRKFIDQQGLFNPKRIRHYRKKLFGLNPGDSHAVIWAYVVFQWWYRKFISQD